MFDHRARRRTRPGRAGRPGRRGLGRGDRRLPAGVRVVARRPGRHHRRRAGPRGGRRLPAGAGLRPAGARRRRPAVDEGAVPRAGPRPRRHPAAGRPGGLLPRPRDLRHRAAGWAPQRRPRPAWPPSSYRSRSLEAATRDLAAALLASPAGAVRATKALLRGAGSLGPRGPADHAGGRSQGTAPGSPPPAAAATRRPSAVVGGATERLAGAPGLSVRAGGGASCGPIRIGADGDRTRHVTATLRLTRKQILAFRRQVGALDQRLPPGRLVVAGSRMGRFAGQHAARCAPLHSRTSGGVVPRQPVRRLPHAREWRGAQRAACCPANRPMRLPATTAARAGDAGRARRPAGGTRGSASASASASPSRGGTHHHPRRS